VIRPATGPSYDVGGLRADVPAAAAAGLAEAAVFCLPAYLAVTGGGATAIPLTVFLPLFLVADAAAVALACRHRESVGTGPAIAAAATVAGVLLAGGGTQRVIFTVAVCLLVGLRAVIVGFRDWGEPVGASFAIGAVLLGAEAVVGTTAPHDWGPPLVVLMPMFFIASLVSRAVSIWMSDDPDESGVIPMDRRMHRVLDAVVTTVWIPIAMAVAALLGMRGGVLDHVGSTLAPLGNALVSILVFVFAQLSRPIFWLVDRLGIDPAGVRRLFARVQRSVDQGRDQALRQAGHSSLLGRLVGLALLGLAAWGIVRLIRRIRPETRGAESRRVPAAIVETVLPLADTQDVRRQTFARRTLPADRVRRWYAEILLALERRGVEKEPAHTPGEFASAVTGIYPECGGSFRAITRAYEDVRYGAARLDRNALRELDGHHRSVLAAIRRRPPDLFPPATDP
jgi:hypothetical protein